MGYHVIVNYVSNDAEARKTIDLITEAGSTGELLKFDVGDNAAAVSAIEGWQDAHPDTYIEVLVNNAGVRKDNLMLWMEQEDWTKVISTSLDAFYNVTRPVLKPMLVRKYGRIINISSTNGINTYYPMCIDYDASKAALISLTHDLAAEFAPYINVNCIAPGFIGTDNELEGYDEEFLKEEVDKIMVKRYGDPKEVAYLVSFLVSDKADFINNTVIRIDGGQMGSV